MSENNNIPAEINFTGEHDVSEKISTYIPVIMIIAYAVFFTGKAGTFSMDNAQFTAGMLLASFGYVKLLSIWMKHKSPKIVYDWGWSTTDGDLKPVGNFYVIRLGDIAIKGKEGIFWPGNEGALIVPIDSVKKVGPCPVANVNVSVKRIDELPDEVIKYLSANNIRGPYKFGMINEEDLMMPLDITKIPGMDNTKLPKPKATNVLSELTERFRQVQFYKKLAFGKMDDIQNFMEGKIRLQGSRVQSMSSKLKDLVSEAALDKNRT